jgi:selenocysteine lyase/cysteine desulfurase
MEPLKCQKSKFTLPRDTHFLNCATFSPSSKKVEKAGIDAIKHMSNPIGLKPIHFFEAVDALCMDLAKLIKVDDYQRIAMMPASSYGMAVLAKNLHRKQGLRAGQEILLLDDEFPNHRYALEREAQSLGLVFVTAEQPDGALKGATWNARILEKINTNTCLVVASQTHWIYGTRFDLNAIGRRCREVGALLAVDGTQSVGACPFDVPSIQPDILMVAGYKWMMAPYSVGFAYYGPFFDDGIPLEESWMHRANSEQFNRLLEYQIAYKSGAQRYHVGEMSNFILIPMFHAAVQELLEHQPDRITAYCEALTLPFMQKLVALGCSVEQNEWRSAHLFGVMLPKGTDTVQVQAALLDKKVIVAVRASSIRVSPNVYNNAQDMEALIDGLSSVLC